MPKNKEKEVEMAKETVAPEENSKETSEEQTAEEVVEKPEEGSPEGEEAVSEEEEAAEEIPETYRGKSTQELIKMHQESEKRMYEATQREATYRKTLENISPPEAQQPIVDKAEITEKFRADFERDPIGTTYRLMSNVLAEESKPFQKDLESLKKTQAREAAYRKHDDYADYDEKVDAVLEDEKYRFLNDIKSQEAKRDAAYAIAKSQDSDRIAKEAEEKGKKEALKNVGKKDEAYVEGAGKKAGKGSDLSSMSSEQMEKILPKAPERPY